MLLVGYGFAWSVFISYTLQGLLYARLAFMRTRSLKTHANANTSPPHYPTRTRFYFSCLLRFGHFAVEKNKPATFLYPTYSLLGDFRMFYSIVTGREPL